MTTILSISGLFSLNSATSVYADSLTLTIPSSPLSLDLNPTMNNGFATTTGSFNVKTDNSAGYTTSIRAKNESGENSLINGNNKLTSISSPISEDTFKNGSEYINMWGWLPSRLNSEDNTNYQIAPGAEEVVLDKTETANAEGQNYNISLAAKVASDTPTGTYTNTFVVTALSNASPQKEYEPNECWGLSEGQTGSMTDPRDGTTYKIARLADGKCWMTENLRITGSSSFKSGHTKKLTSEDSDLQAGEEYELPDSDISKFNVGSNGNGTTEGKNNDAAYYEDDPRYGAYYTWYTATAGTGTASMTSSGQNATSSICPKGWKLPTGGSGGDFQTLTNKYGISSSTDGSNTLRGAPLNFTYVGYVRYSDGSLNYKGSSGHYWSSTVHNQDNAYSLDFDASNVLSAEYNYRPFGFSVRCVARGEKPENKGTMQTVDQWGDSVQEGETVLATDERDNTTYSVARLKDGKLWMTQNLVITGSSSFQPGHSATLNSSDSDVSSDYTIPTSDISKFNLSGVSSSTTQWKENNAAYAETVSYTDSVHGAKSFESGYYTWYTATAGTGTASMTSSRQNATSSICPKGWKLPTGGSGSDFMTLGKAYGISSNTDGSNTLRGDPLNFTYAGSVKYNTGSMAYQGSYGFYWASNAYNSTYVSHMFFDRSRYSSISGELRSEGISVRCVQREPKKITDLQYLQDFGYLNDEEKEQVISSMQNETNYTLTDERDNTQYTIAKLKDGKLWMTQNLRIVGKTITSADSDVTSNYSIPSSATWTDSSTNSDHAYYANNTSYGAYYTWYTATAGTGTSSMTTQGQNAPGSICPKGWRLPTSGSDANSDFQLLAKQYTNGSQLVAIPTPAFTYAGYLNYNDGSLNPQGSGGYYWSSTASYSANAYSLIFSSGGVNPAGGNNSRPYGNSVRCVAR